MIPYFARRGAFGALLLFAAVFAGCEAADTVAGTSACVSVADADDQVARATAGGDEVVAAAEAFYATLSSTQQADLTYDLTLDNADNWSNLPVGIVERNGLRFDGLSEDQLAAALALADASFSEAGYTTFQEIRAADEYLNQNGGGSQYDCTLYFVAYLGTPSTTEAWILQFGGHHYAVNSSYDGEVSSPTPNFVGVEPLSFTLGGTTYAPMAERSETTTALLDALSSDELSEAQLSGSFNDVLLGPGEDFAFPEQEGLLVSSLTEVQQDAVTAAINAWAQDADDETAAELLAEYTSTEAYTETYLGYVGTTDLDTRGDYIRIDGPRVWIEIATQNGIVFPSQVHYHSIWRDKALDYGGIFGTGTSVEAGPCD